MRAEDAAHLRNAIDTGTSVALSTAAPLGATAEFPELSAEEAIVATTYNAASSLRLSHVTGSVEPGKTADVLAVEAADYREFTVASAIRLVIRSGTIIQPLH
jgi:imidazolonepropionase-like amidohydrolase